METRARTLAKAVCWQVLGFAVMTAIGVLVTGSIGEGGRVAALGTATGFLSYVVHERVWARIGWGRHPEPPAPERAARPRGVAEAPGGGPSGLFKPAEIGDEGARPLETARPWPSSPASTTARATATTARSG